MAVELAGIPLAAGAVAAAVIPEFSAAAQN
jgi:hypothetical protein